MTRRRKLAAIIVFSLVSTSRVGAEVTLVAEATVQTGVESRSARVHDLDADGSPELLVLAEDQGVISVLWNDSALFDGDVFSLERRQVIDVGQEPTEIGIGDLNGDGIEDLAIASREDDAVVIFHATREGKLYEQVRLATGEGPYDVIIEDIDSDGHNDIVVGERVDDSVRIFLSQGDGLNFEEHALSTVEETRQVALCDFDGNRSLDLAVAGAELQVFLDHGNDGRFREAQRLDLGDKLQSLVVGDFNGDLLCDIAVTGLENEMLYLLESSGEELFSDDDEDNRFQQVPMPFLPNVLFGDDLNADGLIDVVAGGRSSGTFLVLEGTGQGGMVPAEFSSPVEGISSFSSGDLDNDGRTDLVATGSVQPQAVLFRGFGRQPYDLRKNIELGGLLDQATQASSNGTDATLLITDVRNRSVHVLHADSDFTSPMGHVSTEGPPARIETETRSEDRIVFYSASAGREIDRFLLSADNRGTALPPIDTGAEFVAWTSGRFTSVDNTELVIVTVDGNLRLRTVSATSDEEAAVFPLPDEPYLVKAVALTNSGTDGAVLVTESELRLIALEEGATRTLQRLMLAGPTDVLRVLDVDSDGDEDLVLVDAANRTVTIHHLVEGRYSEDAVAIHLENPPGDVAAPDIDGDGNNDLAVLLRDRAELMLFHREADGRYREQSRLSFEAQPLHVLSLPFENGTATSLMVTFGNKPYIERLSRSENHEPESEHLVFEYVRGDLFHGQLLAADADADTVRYRITRQPDSGTLQLEDELTGRFTFRSDVNTAEDVYFHYRADDGKEASPEAVVKLSEKGGGGGSGPALLLMLSLLGLLAQHAKGTRTAHTL